MILLSLRQKRVSISDEKWLVLHPSPNSQTDRIWALWDPEEEEVCWFQGDSNVMAWVTLVNGHWQWGGRRTSKVAQRPSEASNIIKCCRKKLGQKCACEQEDNGIAGYKMALWRSQQMWSSVSLAKGFAAESSIGGRKSIGSHAVPTSILWIFLAVPLPPSTSIVKAIKPWRAESNCGRRCFDHGQANDPRRSGKYQEALLAVQYGKWRSLWSFPEEAVKTALHKDSNVMFKICLQILLMELYKFFLSQTN